MDEMTFHFLEELNAVLWEKMAQENQENFQGLSYSRADLFEREEKGRCCRCRKPRMSIWNGSWSR